MPLKIVLPSSRYKNIQATNLWWHSP